jgi:hypothetical protein
MNIPNFPPLNHSGRAFVFALAPSGLRPEFLGAQARHNNKTAQTLIDLMFSLSIGLSAVPPGH